jgi:hypothetical protein
MKKKIIKEVPKNEEFFIVNELAEVFSGLKGGLPQFTSDWKLGKSINNEHQFKSVQRGTFDKLEMLKIK